jgi:hypothetical protein
MEADADYDEALLTYIEVTEGPEKKKWLNAIRKEKESIEKNNAWKIINEKEAEGKEILTLKWIFKIKENGKYKARLVVRGCQQRTSEIDYKEIFSSVVDTMSMRTLFAVAAQEDLQMKMFDVKTAFLHGELKEKIYMKIPEGYEEPGKVCQLGKALYGLKQAVCLWNRWLTNFLKKKGMDPLMSDQCIFRSKKDGLFLAIHVDDGIVFGKEMEKIENLMKKLKEEFEITIYKEPKVYLGIDITRNKDGIFLSQENYAQQVLKS